MIKFCKLCNYCKKYTCSDQIFDLFECEHCGHDISACEPIPVDESELPAFLNQQMRIREEREKPEEQISVYILKDCNGEGEIRIPDEGGCIGRNEIGKELLTDRHISKQQVKISINTKRNKVFVEDVSTYNTTLLNGKLMIPGREGRNELKEDDILQLYNRKFQFVIRTHE